MNKEIEALTIKMLKHTFNQNLGVAVGAILNVLMTVLNQVPDKAMREHVATHLHMIADNVSAIDGVKQ